MASVERRSGRRSDVWVVRFRDQNGKQRSKTLHTKADALLFAAKTEVEVKSDDWIDPKRARITFREFHKRWAQARAVSPSRASAEASQAKVHILPRWGEVQLAKIKPLDVAAWVKNSPAGVHTKVEMLGQFRMCLDAAVTEGVIRTNPAKAIKGPGKPRKKVTALDVLDAHEVDLVTKAMPDRWKALVYCSAWLGWRWSEAMGLRWMDLDLENGLAYVGNQVVVESKGVLHVRDTGKTEASTRTVPLPEPVVSVLLWHRGRFASTRTDADRVWLTEPCPPPGRHATRGRKGGCQAKGTCIGHTPFRSNFRRVFLKAVDEAGLGGRGINVRQLRHTAASLMLANGIDVLEVQERLGHSRASITLDIYSRLLTSRRKAANERLGEVMRGQSDTSWAVEP